MDAAVARWNAEKRKLLKAARHYAATLYAVTTVAGLAARFVVKFAPRMVADPMLTIAVFAAATVLFQGRLAKVLERKPAAAGRVAPRLAPLGAWLLALITWTCMTAFFVAYLTVDVGGRRHMSRADWAVASVVSAANLAGAVRTVSRHLA